VLSTLLAISICVLLMVWARRLQSNWKWAFVLAATGLALFWAAAGAFDDYFSADVGVGRNHRRTGLPSAR
jgi:hypothetical protein